MGNSTDPESDSLTYRFEVDRVVRTLRAGDFSPEPLRVAGGFLIFRVINRLPPEPLPFETVKQEVARDMDRGEQQAQALVRAQTLRDRVRAGGNFFTLANAYGEIQHSTWKRGDEIKGIGRPSDAQLDTLLALPEGGAETLTLTYGVAAVSIAKKHVNSNLELSDLIQEGGLTILNDCYNANPQSFRAAIATAAWLRRGRRLVFIAGTMRELGPESAQLHADIARALVELDPDLLAAVGEFVPALAPYADQLDGRLVTADDPVALGPLVAARLRGDEVIVLKASRGVTLERILPALTSRGNSPR